MLYTPMICQRHLWMTDTGCKISNMSISKVPSLEIKDISKLPYNWICLRPSRYTLRCHTAWIKRIGNQLLSLLQKQEKRVETLFSQLGDQFMVCRNYAKQQVGLFARIISKVSAMTVLQYINFINNKPIGRIKYALV